MASVSKDGSGWRIRFIDADGNRKTLRPGKVNKVAAEKIGHYVDQLNAAKISGMSIDRQAALWLAEIGDTLHAKLAKSGLTSPREASNQEPKPEPEANRVTLADFLADHIEHGRTSQGRAASESTLAKWRSTERFLNAQLPGRTLESITAEDAHQFRKWLDTRRIEQKTSARNGELMAENAKRKHIANCKTFFNAAKRRGLIDRNPFEAQVSSTSANRSRDYYLTPENTAKILRAAPDAQWRLLIALWRLAGLRKMEVFGLKWGDVLWNQGKLLVRIPKTQHHEGCELRYTPLRDVRPYLEEAFLAALPEGKQSLPADQPIVSRFAASNSNLDKPFRQIIEAAGLVPWPKLFQNLRASCETQWLKEGNRADLVANWIGHSVKVQNQNYVQQTDDDIELFNSKPAFSPGPESGPVDTGTDQKPLEDSGPKPKRNAETQCFPYSNLPWAGLEPARPFRNNGF